MIGKDVADMGMTDAQFKAFIRLLDKQILNAMEKENREEMLKELLEIRKDFEKALQD